MYVDRSSLSLIAVVVVYLMLGCSAGSLLTRPTPTPPPTRVQAPTFTPTPDQVQALVIVTPPRSGTPGVIIVPPGVDPRSLVPVTPSATPTETSSPTITPTPSPSSTPSPTRIGDSSDLPDEQTQITTTATPDQTQAPSVPIPAATSPIILPTPTATPTVPPTNTPTETPTPFVIVQTGLVNLREGPGVDFPLVAQLGPNIPVAIIGQNPEGTWYQICCVNGGSVWVAESHIQTVNDTTAIALVLSGPAPTPTETGTPTETPTVTPTPTATPYPFQIVQGPLYFPTSNEMLTIWVRVTSGGAPLPGYHLKVLFRNRADNSAFESRPNTRGEQPSSGTFEFNVPPGPGSGNRVEYNYKFEFLPPDPRAEDPATTDTRLSLIDGYWQVYLTDGSGTQLSPAVEFNTLAGNNNREVFIAWDNMQ